MAQGTLTLTNGSAAVTGSGTAFGTQNRVGDFIVVMIGGMSYSVVIGSIQSATALTLSEVFYGPTTANLAWDAVPLNAVTAIPYQLGVQQLKALRLMNLESDNWLQLYTGTGNITVNLPDGKQYTGPSLKYYQNLVNTGGGADYSFLYSPGGQYRIVVGNSGLFALQDRNGTNKAIDIYAGGTGATTAAGARDNLELGKNHAPTFGGVNLDASDTIPNSGILQMRRVNANGTVISYGRVYHEIVTGKSVVTIHANNGNKNRYLQFNEEGMLSGLDNILLQKQLTFSSLPDTARIVIADVITGASGAMTTSKVEGGLWDDWRNKAAGHIIEHPTLDTASTIFKTVKWGSDWGSCMSSVISSNNNHILGLFVGSASWKFNMIGGAVGQWVSSSDLRMKANLKPIESASEKIAALKGYTYFKRDTLIENDQSFYQEEAGLIAQDVNPVLPEAVYEFGPEKMLGVNYNGVVALLVNGFNELADTVKRQGARIEELEALLAKK
ncbi:tail fiber domain-containing protein [Cedecea lapagei]|uniref:tail fiber domain-containing protein n=1 Tax=Cedecea lapagei TaxID=158823 RepID=UPI001BD116C1|nr:tail fiber domain-containing protein [Cedecea lapagei]